MRFLFNSYPKSGNQTFANVIRYAIADIREYNKEERPEFKDWVICQYEPVVHLADFGKEITQVSVIRNPSDAITINVERMLRGFFGRQIYSVDTRDKEMDILDTKEYLTEYDKGYIDHEIDRYNSYIACLDKNIDKIICFTNEQTKYLTSDCTKNLLSLSSIDYTKIDNSMFINYPAKYIPYHNFSEKIKFYIENNKNFALGYNDIIEKIKDKQKQYPIQINQYI